MQPKAQIEQTKTQIAEAAGNIKRIQSEQDNMAKSIAMYEARIQAAPLNERQWAALQRDHALAQQDYDDKVKKRQAAETSQNLEEHKAGENLEVLDPASDPQQPTEPNAPEWAAIGTGLGLLLGVVLAGGKEMKNTSLEESEGCSGLHQSSGVEQHSAARECAAGAPQAPAILAGVVERVYLRIHGSVGLGVLLLFGQK